MKRQNSVRLSATAALLCSISSFAMAQQTTTEQLPATELDPIYVRRAVHTAKGTQYVLVPRQINIAPAKDGGSLISSVPGVSAGRMGGHGIEIVIRGNRATS